MFEDLAGGGLADRQPGALHRLDVPGAGLHNELVAVPEHDHEAARTDEGASALDDQFEYVLERDLASDRDGNVACGLEATDRALGFGTAQLAGLIEAGVDDRHCRPVGEDHGGFLVLLGELSTLLLGEVQVSPRLTADPDRHAEEAAHHGMPGGEPVARGVLSDVREPQRLWVLDKRAKDPAATWEVADRAVSLLVHTGGQELLELCALLVEDPERGVLGARDLSRGLKYPVENDVEVEAR